MTAQDLKQRETAVLDVLKGVQAAWKKNDPDQFVVEYLEDASATLPGAYMPSREAIRGAMAYTFNGPLKGTQTSETVLGVRFLSDEVAVVITENGVLIPGESEAPPERTSYATWVLAQRDDKWLVAAYSSSPKVGPSPQ